MDYELTAEQEGLRSRMADFCRDEIWPSAGLLDETPRDRVGELMRANLGKLARGGYLALAQGEDLISQCVAGEELAKACPSTFVSAMSSATAFGVPVRLNGTSAQRDKYLPALARGDLVGCLAFSEAGAGSDLGGIQTVAERKGNGWSISGAKDLVTNAPIADAHLVLAWTDRSAGPEGGMTFFLLARGTRGLAVGPPVETMGLRGAPVAEIRLEGCEVSSEAVLGQAVGGGFRQLDAAMGFVKLAMSTLAVGLGARCMEESTNHAKQRRAFGKPIGFFEGVGAKLATMFTFNDLGRMMTLRAAWGIEQKDPESAVLAACAKLFTSESAKRVADMAMQVHGGHGYLKGTVVERLYRDARFAEVAYGTSEMLRAFVAKDSLGRFRAA